MNKKINELIKTKIKNYYELLSTDSQFLDTNASSIVNPSIIEFQKEINNSIKSAREEYVQNIQTNIPEIIEELEEVNVDEIYNSEHININLLNSVEEKVIKILQYLNISFYKKDDLKQIIIDDMLALFYNLNLNEITIKQVKNVISNLVDHEFQEYYRKKMERRQKLLDDLFNKSSNEIDKLLDSHFKSKIANINKYQIENFIKFLFEYIDNKYIKEDKKNKKLNQDEYLFLKTCMRTNIINRYVEYQRKKQNG